MYPTSELPTAPLTWQAAFLGGHWLSCMTKGLRVRLLSRRFRFILVRGRWETRFGRAPVQTAVGTGQDMDRDPTHDGCSDDGRSRTSHAAVVPAGHTRLFPFATYTQPRQTASCPIGCQTPDTRAHHHHSGRVCPLFPFPIMTRLWVQSWPGHLALWQKDKNNLDPISF
jgi:hypothetical protein